MPIVWSYILVLIANRLIVTHVDRIYTDFRFTGTGSSKKIGDLGEYRPIVDVREAEGELSPYDRAYNSIPPTSGKNFQA